MTTIQKYLFVLLSIASVGAGLPPLPSNAHIKKHHVAPLLSPKQQSIQIVKTKVITLSVQVQTKTLEATWPSNNYYEWACFEYATNLSETKAWSMIIQYPYPTNGNTLVCPVPSNYSNMFFRASSRYK